MIVAQRFRRPNHDDFFELSRLRGGEGLHPELRLLFERAATSPVSDVVIRHDGLLQSGPGPAAEIVPERVNVSLFSASLSPADGRDEPES